MKTKNLLYLAQLEEYDINRISKWLKENPNKTVYEKKSHLKWTNRARFVFIWTTIFAPLLNQEKSLFSAIKISSFFSSTIINIFVNLARLKFSFFNKKTTVIAITGSWGKTTIKENLFHIFKNNLKTVITPENQNTLFSIAKTALKTSSSTKILICEIGAYQKGDIQQACRIINPKIGILTAIGPMHLERFNTLENILETKMELAESLPKNGIFWAPKNLKNKLEKFSLPKNINYFDDYSQIYFSLGFNFNVSQKDIQQTLNSIPSVKNRQQIIKNGPITIIDDSYNSNPAGFEKALNKLKEIKSDQKILITPGMIELGSMQFSENARLATIASKICDHIIIVGQTNKEALLSGLKNTSAKIHTIQNLSETDILLPSIYKGTSTVLFENDLGDQYF